MFKEVKDGCSGTADSIRRLAKCKDYVNLARIM